MKTLKEPAIFLAQFMRDEAPHNNLDNVCKWAADKGFKGLQKDQARLAQKSDRC